MMKNRIHPIILELIPLGLGTAAALFQAIFVNDSNLAITIFVITLLISTSSYSIRQYISSQSTSDPHTQKLIQQIQKLSWRIDAEEDYKNFIDHLQMMNAGRRTIPIGNSIPYQIGLLNNARNCVQAVHIGIPADDLLLWAKEEGSFSRLAAANQSLSPSVSKRRLFICDSKELLNENRKIKNPHLQQVFKRHTASRSQGGLDFEVRIVWTAMIQKQQLPDLPDLLIIDNSESIIIKKYNGRYMDMEDSINPIDINHRQKLFEQYWTIAHSINNYVD